MIINKRKCPKCKREYQGVEESGQFTLHQNNEICNDCYLKDKIVDTNERVELRIRNAILNKNKSKTRISRQLKIHNYKIDHIIEKMEQNGLLEVCKNRKGFKFYKIK